MTEQLAAQPIEGVLAEGTRTTTTYPAGFFGNDRPVTTINEELDIARAWYARVNETVVGPALRRDDDDAVIQYLARRAGCVVIPAARRITKLLTRRLIFGNSAECLLIWS